MISGRRRFVFVHCNFVLHKSNCPSETHGDNEATTIYIGVKEKCDFAEAAVRTGEMLLPLVSAQKRQQKAVRGAPGGQRRCTDGGGDGRERGGRDGRGGGGGLQGGGGGQKVHHNRLKGLDGLHDRLGRVEADEDKAGEGTRNQ